MERKLFIYGKGAFNERYIYIRTYQLFVNG